MQTGKSAPQNPRAAAQELPAHEGRVADARGSVKYLCLSVFICGSIPSCRRVIVVKTQSSLRSVRSLCLCASVVAFGRGNVALRSSATPPRRVIVK